NAVTWYLVASVILLLLLLSLLFFSWYGHPLDLHSFPTRRSSDLSCSARWRSTTTTIRSGRWWRSCSICRASRRSLISRSEGARVLPSGKSKAAWRSWTFHSPPCSPPRRD